MKTKHRFAAFYIPYTAARTSERVNSTSIREGESTFPLFGMGTGERDIVVNDCFVTHALRESFRFALCESILTPVNGCISGYKRRNRTLSTTIFRVRIPRLGRKNYVTRQRVWSNGHGASAVIGLLAARSNIRSNRVKPAGNYRLPIVTPTKALDIPRVFAAIYIYIHNFDTIFKIESSSRISKFPTLLPPDQHFEPISKPVESLVN